MARSRWLVSAGYLWLAAWFAFVTGATAHAADRAATKDKRPAVAETPETEASDESDATKFIRVTNGDDGEPLYLETAIVRFEPESGEKNRSIDLIGAVHVGEKSYYDELNRRFKDYDAVLYELVKPAEMEIPKDQKLSTDSPISKLQKFLHVVLGLEGQLENIDYSADNFVHADMTPEEMGKAIRDRGLDPSTLVMKVFSEAFEQYANPKDEKQKELNKKLEEVDVFTMLLDPAGGVKMKKTMAQMFAMGDPSAGIGDTLGSILIEDRNGAAMKVVRKEFASGHDRLALFYGAAHMPDFQKRLKDELGLVPGEVTWVKAWDIRKKTKVSGLGALIQVLSE